MDKQSEFDALRRQQADEALMMYAAAESVRQQQEDFFAAQDLPAPPPELMARVDANVYNMLRRGSRKKKVFATLAGLGKAAAAVALISGAVLTLGYVSVDATREKINAFLLENFGTHVVVQTQETEEGTGSLFPLEWDGPVRPGWIPKRFTFVESQSSGRTKFLYYTSSSPSDIIIISIWPSTAAPFWDAEQMDSVQSVIIQNVSADLCYKNDTGSHLLRFTKNDITIQIVGSLTSEEIIKIAENISF